MTSTGSSPLVEAVNHSVVGVLPGASFHAHSSDILASCHRASRFWRAGRGVSRRSSC